MSDSESSPHKYKRVLLKLSGEALLGSREYGLDPAMIGRVAQEISDVQKSGIQVSVVIGGGNIFRGVAGASRGMDRSTADYMGMLATVINALALQGALEGVGLETRVLSAIPMESVAERYIRRRAIRHMEKGRVVVFAAGSGNPFFTTDTASSLRASEIGCDAIFKGTKVDGVYDKDPEKHSDAQFIEKVSYKDVLARDLRVMDAAAISLARESNIPIIVFSINKQGGFVDAVQERGRFTTISETKA